MGRRIIEDIIQEEILFMLSYIDNQNGSLNTSAKPPLFSLVLANIILKLIANIRTDYQDELLGNLLNDISVFEKAFRLDNPVNILPILRFIHPEFKVFTKAVSKLQTFLNGLIDNHIQHYNDDNISDYIDAYLQRMKEEEENEVLMSSFTKEQLIYTIEDLFLAAIETTAVTFKWMILFMLHFPNIQKKIQAEIDTVVGRGRNPTWEDKQNLPYTEATILEVQRMGNITTLGIPHKALEEGQVDGYEIPKGSIIIADMTSIHYDPMYWPEPNKFDPTRFLDKEGNVRKCVNSFAPFSIGVALTEGKLWKEQQRFCLSTLRSFGMGRRIINDIIQEEISFMLSYIENQNAISFNTSSRLPIFSLVIANVILKLIANIRTDYHDELLSRLINDLHVVDKGLRLDNPVNILPILRFIHPEFKVYTKAVSEIKTYFNGLIDNHIQQYNGDNISDYIDAYLQRMEEEEENKVLMSTFTRDQLIHTIEDLFLAAIETTVSTLKWLVLFMLHFPNIQKKIQAEIVRVVGEGRIPSWDDKPRLPYTEATILEVQRLANVAQLLIPHKALEGGHVDGYEIPKGSIIIADMKSIHYDPIFWPEPNKFDPTRFLDKEGNVRKSINSFAPFSIGTRSCIGENLAKMELFLIFSSLLQKFTFSSPQGEVPPDLVPQTNTYLSMPLPFNVCATPRTI